MRNVVEAGAAAAGAGFLDLHDIYRWDALQQATLWLADALGLGQVAGIVDGDTHRVHTVVSDGGGQRLIVPLVNVLDPGAEGAGACGAVTVIVQQLGIVLQHAAARGAVAHDDIQRTGVLEQAYVGAREPPQLRPVTLIVLGRTTAHLTARRLHLQDRLLIRRADRQTSRAAHAMAHDVVVRQLGGKDVLALDGPRQSVKAAHGSGNKAQRSPSGGGRGT